MIDTIIFDIGNVLIEFNIDKIIASYEKDPWRQNQLKKTIFSSGIWEKTDSGAYSLKKAIKEVQQQLDTSYYSTIEKIFFNWYEKTNCYTDLQQYALQLGTLGYGIYILSNTSEIYYLMEKSGYLPIKNKLSGKMLSFEERVMKPHKELYHRLIDKYKLIPTQCLFIDDIKENIETAKKLRLTTIISQEENENIRQIDVLLQTKGKYHLM